MSIPLWKLGFIGCGNMGAALARGVIQSGLLTPDRVLLADADHAKAASLAAELGAEALPANSALAARADVLILAAKPQNMAELLDELAALSVRPLYISIAAGISTAWMERRLGDGARVIRVMPNTPAMIGCGAAGCARGSRADTLDMALALQIFEAVGIAVEVDESRINAVTGLSGSGPAYVFRMIEVMARAGKQVGLPAEDAMRLTLQTVLGAARMAAETGTDPSELRRRVTSPKGTTEMGLKALDDGGFEALVERAVAAATARGEELGRIFEQD